MSRLHVVDSSGLVHDAVAGIIAKVSQLDLKEITIIGADKDDTLYVLSSYSRLPDILWDLHHAADAIMGQE